jgi:adenylylsulfate kinase
MQSITKVFWLFGRSGAGKTTLARGLCRRLKNAAIPVAYLDADELRATLCSDLGFSPAARLENHRRIAEVARQLARQRLNVVVSTMAPEYAQRDRVAGVLREMLVWFYIYAPLEICVARDPKGLYHRARSGEVKNLIDYPFDTPRAQECPNHVDTTTHNIEACCDRIMDVARAQLADFAI